MTPEEKSRAIREFHTQWAQRWSLTVIPDPEYAERKRTQYPETAVDLSASAEAEIDYWRGISRILGKPLTDDAVKAPEITKAPRAAVNNALAMLDNLPTVETRDGKELIAAPWPVVERPNLDPDMWIDSVVTDVPIVDLFATQTVLNRERVAEFVQNPGAIENGRRALANVYDNGRMLIVDGHHRLAAYWLLGAERANVWYLVES